MLGICIFPLFLFYLTSALTTKEYEIFDLQDNTADFLQEASPWQVTGALTSTRTSICSSNYLLGGYQTLSHSVTLQRTYTVSKSHNSIFISFEAWMMANWYKNDQFSLQVKSGTTTFSTQSLLTQTTGSNQAVNFEVSGTCTASSASVYSEKIMLVSSPHTGSTLTLFFQMATSASSGTMGIRNVRILISDAVLTSPSQCMDIVSPYITNVCACPAGQRKSGSTCVDCDPSCESCFDATSSSCYACNSNYYYDGTSCQKCFAGCATCSAGAETDCLTCETGYFMYPSGACKSSCGAPYTSGSVGGINHCYLPCGQTDNYYYSGDSTCRSTCESPFTSLKDANGAKFCNYPCKSLSQYLYPNGSCLTTQCSGYFELKNYFSSAQYKSCECASPHLLTADGNCTEPATPIEIETSEPDDDFMTKLAKVGNTTGVINSVGLAVQAVALSGDPGGVSAGALTRIIQYSKYLNISYPEKLILMFRLYNPASGVVSLIPKMTSEQKNKFIDEPIPYNFMAYGVHSCFVVNFWNFMLFLLILFGVCGAFLILEKLLPGLGIWIRKARMILQNFWIVQLYNSSGDILLFSSVQFRYNHWNSAEATLNFLMAICFLLMMGTVLAFHLRTLLEYQRVRKEPSDLKAFEKNYECQQVFFGSFVDSTINHQLFLFYFVLRVMLTNLIIAVLMEYPMIQTILMVVISLILAIYLVLKRPFRSKIDLAQNLSYEMVLLTVNIALLSFATLDGENEEKISTRNRLAEVIIICSVTFTFLPLFFMALKVIAIGLQFYKEYAQKQAQKESLALAKEKQEFVQRVEELRMTRQTERPNLLRIRHSRENQFIAKNIQDPSTVGQFDLNNSSFMENANKKGFYNQSVKSRNSKGIRNQNRQFPPDQFVNSSSGLYPLDHSNGSRSSQKTLAYLDSTLDLNNSNMLENKINSFHNHSIHSRSKRTRNNNFEHSPELPEDLSMSIYPLNNNHDSTINYQNTNPYLDSTLDFTQLEMQYQENTIEREMGFIPKRSGKGRLQPKMSQQHGRAKGLERHPFHQEIKNHVNDDGAILENIKARSTRISGRIKKRMQSRRKTSEFGKKDVDEN